MVPVVSLVAIKEEKSAGQTFATQQHLHVDADRHGFRIVFAFYAFVVFDP
jgi:hypothetical protein